MSSDNTSFDLTGFSLDLCLQIAAHCTPGGKLAYYAVDQPLKADPECSWIRPHGKRLVLGWTITDGMQLEGREIFKLPSPIKVIEAGTIVHAWLEAADYGPKPDHDGSNGKGWRCYNESWGHVGHWSAFAAFEPEWLMYGK